MRFTFRIFIVFILLLSPQLFFAQETTISSEKSILEAKTAKEHQDKISKEQKKLKKHQRDVKNAEKSIQKTQKKIEKQKAANQKTARKIATSTNSEEEIQKRKEKQKLYTKPCLVCLFLLMRN